MLWHHRDGRRRISGYHIRQIASIARVFNRWACRTCNILVRMPAIYRVTRRGTKVKHPFSFLLKTFNCNEIYVYHQYIPCMRFFFCKSLLQSQHNFFPHLSTLYASCAKFFAEASKLFKRAVSAPSPTERRPWIASCVLYFRLTKTHKFIKFTLIYVKVKHYFPLCMPCRHTVEYRYSSMYFQSQFCAPHTHCPWGKTVPGTHWQTGNMGAPEMVWTCWRREKSLAPTINETTISQLSSP